MYILYVHIYFYSPALFRTELSLVTSRHTRPYHSTPASEAISRLRVIRVASRLRTDFIRNLTARENSLCGEIGSQDISGHELRIKGSQATSAFAVTSFDCVDVTVITRAATFPRDITSHFLPGNRCCGSVSLVRNSEPFKAAFPNTLQPLCSTPKC